MEADALPALRPQVRLGVQGRQLPGLRCRDPGMGKPSSPGGHRDATACPGAPACEADVKAGAALRGGQVGGAETVISEGAVPAVGSR